MNQVFIRGLRRVRNTTYLWCLNASVNVQWSTHPSQVRNAVSDKARRVVLEGVALVLTDDKYLAFWRLSWSDTIVYAIKRFKPRPTATVERPSWSSSTSLAARQCPYQSRLKLASDKNILSSPQQTTASDGTLEGAALIMYMTANKYLPLWRFSRRAWPHSDHHSEILKPSAS